MTSFDAIEDSQEAAKRNLWLHFTRMSAYENSDVPVIVRGSGAYVFDQHGNAAEHMSLPARPEEVGTGEVAYDTLGMVVAKRRSDLFRHWLLGFGSGDLLVKTAGAASQQFEMHNILFVGNKLQLIQQMLQTREVVGGD